MSTSPPNYLYNRTNQPISTPAGYVQQTTTIDMSDESQDMPPTTNDQEVVQSLTETQQQTQKQQISQQPEIEQQSTAMMINNQNPQIPISHLMATNNYPSLSTVPPNIAKSFAPVFVQPPTQQANSDIYNDYVQNPYNITLLRSDDHNNVEITEATTTTSNIVVETDAVNENLSSSQLKQNLGVSNMFQSSNYFNTDAIIPPGSEMLFTGP